MIALALALGTALAQEPAAADASDAAAPSDPVLHALLEEMSRGRTGLSLPDAPDIYHMRYHVMAMEQVDVIASLGALVHESSDPYNALAVEMRVGSPAYDNTGFGGWQNGFMFGWLPERVTADAVALDAWRMTDRAYKQAVEQYARKKAQFTAPPEYPGDYLLTGPTVADDGQPVAVDGDALQKRAVAVSGAFVFDGSPALVRGEVHVGQESGTHTIVDTEGTRVVRPMEECTIRAFAQIRADDGLMISDQRLWTVREPGQLPSLEEMQAEVRQLTETLVAASKAKKLEDEYVGPVIFEDSAAVDLFRFLLVPQVEGTPAEVPFESWFGDIGTESGSVRIGRRVLPMGWSVVDDPTEQEGHPAHFRHDLEGSEAVEVPLITDGIVRTLLMSRVPRKELVGSNGHARGSIGARASGRAAVMTVTPDKALSSAKLRKKALKLAGSYGHDYVIVVRRLQEPAIQAYGDASGLFFGGGDESAALPSPVALVRVYADGREELVRGASFTGVHRWVLRDIVAAGEQESISFMAPPDGGSPAYLGPTEGLATWLSAPEVLIGEMELVPENGDPRDVPILPAPTRGAAPAR